MAFGAYQMICCCLAVPNQTRATHSAPSLDSQRNIEGDDLPGTGLADLYPWPREIVSQPLVVFEKTAELELGH